MHLVVVVVDDTPLDDSRECPENAPLVRNSQLYGFLHALYVMVQVRIVAASHSAAAAAAVCSSSRVREFSLFHLMKYFRS